jgi:hypothetical protein
MKTNDIRFIDYQTGQKGQGKRSTDRDRWVVYNGSKVHGSRCQVVSRSLGVEK